MSSIIVRRPWTRQPQYAVGIDHSNSLTKGLQLLWSADTSGRTAYGGRATPNGTLGRKATSRGVAVTNSGEVVSSGTAANFLQFPATSGSEVTILFVGGRNSTPPGSGVAVGVCTRSSTNSSGYELDLGNAFGNPNLLYWYGFASENNYGVVVDGRLASGNNPTDQTITNGQTYSIAAALSNHTVGAGHTLLAKAAGISDFASDVFCLVYAYWNRRLSNEELVRVSRNPWQLFAARQIIIPYAPTGATAPTISDLRATSITSTSVQATYDYVF